jgi:DNA polymerase IIIc chi subunit
MKNATFYLLDNDTHQDGLSAVEQLVCDIAAERWRSGKRVLIACEDEQQAIRLDEALWARPRKVLSRIIWREKAPEAARRWRLPGRKSATAARGIF